MEFRLLASLDPALRREVLALSQRRRFGRGVVIFHEGDPGDSLHLIVKGRVAVRASTPEGDLATLTVLGVGAAFGEQALIDPSARRTATVAAIESTETMVLRRTEFECLRQTHPSIDRLLVEHLAEQVRRLSVRLTEALYVAAERRIARRVLELDDLYEGGEIQVTQEDVATMAGTTRPTVNRIMRELVEDQVISVGRGRFAVVDRPRLERRAR